MFSSLTFYIVGFIALLLSIGFHEFCHAWAADSLGDSTPRMQGRLTLNPLAHLDPFGVIALLLTGFGWGRPVQFDPYNLKDPRRDAALIALAGPASNLVIATVFAIIFHLLGGAASAGTLFSDLAIHVIELNLGLAIFNFVPVYPLDGQKILSALLPYELANEYEMLMHQFGIIILIALLFPWGAMGSPVVFLIEPVIAFFAHLLGVM